MSSFFINGRLLQEYISRRKYRVTRDLHYRSLTGRVYVVVSGTVHNGYSLVFFMRGIFQRVDKYPEGAAFHDAAYGGTLCEASGFGLIPIKPNREESDQLLREIMKRLGASWFLYQSIYYGLRAFGASSYHE